MPVVGGMVLAKNLDGMGYVPDEVKVVLVLAQW